MEFSVWCLNPACVFKQIGEQARSVIVTSGTLSPMTSFASELGVEFESVLEGEHVVPKQQVRLLRPTPLLQSNNGYTFVCAFSRIVWLDSIVEHLNSDMESL